MTPYPASHDDIPPTRGRRRLVSATSATLTSATLVGAFFVATSILLSGGCKRPPSMVVDGTKTATDKTDPWVAAGRRLAKDTDYSTCLAVLRGLSENLRGDDTSHKPTTMTEEWEKVLEPVPLSPEDREEIHNWAYSSHDAAYLAECLYLRDVAQSLRLPNLTPEQLADLAFAWVCRAVSLSEAPLGTDPRTGFLQTERVGNGGQIVIAPAVPPVYVLRRGSGTALERMYVFLAILQQLDLDGCLIGPPRAGSAGVVNALSEDGKPLIGGPARPFWGVGVRTGSEVRAYDPWRGELFPAALAALMANPDVHKAWFDSSANLSRLKPADVKEATTYLTVPVNSLSVRMDLLNQKLKEPLGVRLAYNPTALRASFAGLKPVFWNPPTDRYAYGRVSRTFLPRDLGGNPPDNVLYEQYKRTQVPLRGIDLDLPEFHDEDMKDDVLRFVNGTYSLYVQTFVDPPNPRERIQRGQFQDAIRDLVEKQDRFSKGLEALHNTPNADDRIRAWARDAKQLYLNLGRAGLLADPDDRQAAAAAARVAIDAHWREKAVLLVVTRSAFPVCQAETVFEQCLCKHEMAERAQVRADHAAGDAPTLNQQAGEAWRDALSQWRTYEEGYMDAQNFISGRTEQTRTLKARAEHYATRTGK